MTFQNVFPNKFDLDFSLKWDKISIITFTVFEKGVENIFSLFGKYNDSVFVNILNLLIFQILTESTIKKVKLKLMIWGAYS